MSRLAYNPVVVLAGVFAGILILQLIFSGHVSLGPAVFGGLGGAAASTASMLGTRWRARRRSQD